MYLVERYWPGVTSELLTEALAVSRRMTERMTERMTDRTTEQMTDRTRAGGSPVRHIASILVPDEEVVFSVYEGPSATEVRQFNERASIRVSRITGMLWIPGEQAGQAPG
jgi:hypothetical protein